MDLTAAISAFCAHLAADKRSPATIRAYQADLANFARIAQIKNICDIRTDFTVGTLTTIIESTEISQAKGKIRSDAALHRLKAAIRTFFTWACDTGIIDSNPASKIKMYRLSRKPPVFLTFSEKKDLLKELKNHSNFSDFRDRVMIEVLLGTGLRLSELANLNIQDIDIVTKHIRIKAKGNIYLVKFIKTDLRVLLRRYLVERERNGPTGCEALFLSNRNARLTDRQIANRLQYWLKKAGIQKHITPHGLRHTFATHLYSATNDLLVVQKALGHRDISTTQIYTHLVDGRLEEALERL